MDKQEFSYGFLQVDKLAPTEVNEEQGLDLEMDIFPPLAPGVGHDLPQSNGDRLGG